MKGKGKLYVVDVAGLTLKIKDGALYTTPEILEEAKGEIKEAVIQARVEGGELVIREADHLFVERARAEADRTGDRRVLSDADISLLALFLDLSDREETVLLTDDYALQNIALSLGLEVKSIVGRRIRDVLIWRVYCPICRREFSSNYGGDKCPDCGSILSRRAV